MTNVLPKLGSKSLLFPALAWTIPTHACGSSEFKYNHPRYHPKDENTPLCWPPLSPGLIFLRPSLRGIKYQNKRSANNLFLRICFLGRFLRRLHHSENSASENNQKSSLFVWKTCYVHRLFNEYLWHQIQLDLNSKIFKRGHLS